jgi:hypothetical protein
MFSAAPGSLTRAQRQPDTPPPPPGRGRHPFARLWQHAEGHRRDVVLACVERFLDRGANEILQVLTTVLVIGGAFFVVAPGIAWFAMAPIPVILTAPCASSDHSSRATPPSASRSGS